jgi:rare lipoprotein A (peptidoglycan hydrolase)
MKARTVPLLVVLLACVAACDQEGTEEEGWEEMETASSSLMARGQASFYGMGDGFHCRRTASGEIFNRCKLTAAHRTLAFGTCVRVTHRETDESVIVRINDRGPFSGGRIIDLSWHAFYFLDHPDRGVLPVSIQALPRGTGCPDDPRHLVIDGDPSPCRC